jgi:hypothetical protein
MHLVPRTPCGQRVLSAACRFRTHEKALSALLRSLSRRSASMLPLRVRAWAQMQRIIITRASSDPIAEDPLSLSRLSRQGGGEKNCQKGSSPATCVHDKQSEPAGPLAEHVSELVKWR